MNDEVNADVNALFRDPYPGFLEQAKWWFVRRFTSREVPPMAWVKLVCPETERVFATENDSPTDIRYPGDFDSEGVYGYNCSQCGSTHWYLWGAPAPIRVKEP